MKLDILHDDLILERGNRRAKFQDQLDRLGLSSKRLAKKAGIHPSTVSRYKRHGRRGGRQPSLATLRALAKQGLDVLDLFDINKPIDPEPTLDDLQRSWGTQIDDLELL